MLKHGEAKVIIAPKNFRGFDFENMIKAIQPNLPDLKHIVVVDGETVETHADGLLITGRHPGAVEAFDTLFLEAINRL
jgi:cyclohexanecarboxylate-CoA ligase